MSEVKQTYTCEVCAKPFERYTSQSRKRVYCSTACSGLSRRHGSHLMCEWCGVEFYRRFGEQLRNNAGAGAP